MNVKLSLTLREEHRFRVSESKVLSKIYGSKKEEQNDGENYITRSLIIFILSPNISRMILHAYMRNTIQMNKKQRKRQKENNKMHL